MAFYVPSDMGSPQTPFYASAAAPSGLEVAAPLSPSLLFVGTERNAMADAQLQRDARVEALQRRWAEARPCLHTRLGPRALHRACCSAGGQLLRRLAAGHVAAGVGAVARAGQRRSPGRASLCSAFSREPSFDASQRPQVATVNDVVLYDVRTLPPYRAALEADDEVRPTCAAARCAP
jgi:hypothetical protein